MTTTIELDGRRVGLVVGITLLVAALVIGVVYWSQSTASAATNETCVVYSGGSFEEREFQEILPPGTTNKIVGWGSTSRCYRNDQRSFIGSNDPGADTKPVNVVGKGTEGDEASQLPCTIDFSLYFTLNTQEDVLKQFDRTIGIKTHANTEEGWAEMLRDYFRPQVVRSMQNGAGGYSCIDLYSNPKARAEYQNDVIRLFKASLTKDIGADYFCQPNYVPTDKATCADITFTIGNPVLPESVQKAIEGQVAAERETLRQAEENRKTEKALEAERQQVELYGANGALIKQAIESGRITFYVLPDGQTVPVPAPAP